MILKKIRKGHVDWNKFLCGIPAKDYVFQKDAYEDQIKNAAKLLKDADAVIIVPVRELPRRQDLRMVESGFGKTLRNSSENMVVSI